jgi:hypothetical protein
MMSFSAFSRIPSLLFEEGGDTMFYTWRATDRATTVSLHRFVQTLVANGSLPSPSLLPPDIHMSIIRSENDLPNYVPDKQTIRVKPLQWRLLGGNPNYYLAIITTPHDRIKKQLEIAKKMKAELVFPNFLPHISVAQFKTRHVEFEHLPLPKFDIVLEAEERHEFNKFM